MGVVAKLGGERWKALTANQKAPYEKKAESNKVAYEKAMEEFKAAGGQPGKRRQEKAALKKERADKKAKKGARKNSGKPAKPPSAYWIWMNENREALQKELGTKQIGVVGKAAGERWKTLPAAHKAKFETIAADKRSAYEMAVAEWKEQQGNKENADEKEDEEDDDEDADE